MPVLLPPLPGQGVNSDDVYHHDDDTAELGCDEVGSHTPSISKEVFHFYDAFGDTTIPIFNKPPSPSPHWDNIRYHIKTSIILAADCSMSSGECYVNYKHI